MNATKQLTAKTAIVAVSIFHLRELLLLTAIFLSGMWPS
jgi:hypothetical protein